MPDKEGNDAEASQDTRKRRRTTRGSQTDDEPSKSEESNPPNNMAATLAEINSKLDLALAGIKEIEELPTQATQSVNVVSFYRRVDEPLDEYSLDGSTPPPAHVDLPVLHQEKPAKKPKKISQSPRSIKM